MNAYAEKDLFQFISESGTLSVEALQKWLEWRENMTIKREEIKKKYQIRQLPSKNGKAGRYYTRINGKQFGISTTEEGVIDKLLALENKTNITTLTSIFDSTDYRDYRRVAVACTTWGKDVFYYEKFIKGSALAEKEITEIGKKDIRQFFLHCLEVKPDMKERYWDNVRGAVSSIFNFAIEEDIVKANPTDGFKPNKNNFAPKKETRDSDRIFSESEQAKVCAVAAEDCRQTGNGAPLSIVILFNLGVRDGELLALKWKDIEYNDVSSYIHIQREFISNVDEKGKYHGKILVDHCKSAAGDRRLLLNSQCKETFSLIKTLNAKNGFPTGNDDFIFLISKKGAIRPCTDRSIYPRLKKYCMQAGLDSVKSPHDIRRTVATNLYYAGMPLKDIQYFMGHSSLQQTLDYIYFKQEQSYGTYLEKLQQVALPNGDSNIIPLSEVQHRATNPAAQQKRSKAL